MPFDARRPGRWPPRRAGALQDPLDRAHRRHDRAELLQLPRDRGRADLRPRVGLQRARTSSTCASTSASVRAPPAWAHASGPAPTPDRAGHSAPPTSPPTAACAPDPGRSPAATRPPTCAAPPHDAAPTSSVLHPHLPRSINTSARASKHPRMETMCWRLNPQPRKRSAGGLGKRCAGGRHLESPLPPQPATSAATTNRQSAGRVPTVYRRPRRRWGSSSSRSSRTELPPVGGSRSRRRHARATRRV